MNELWTQFLAKWIFGDWAHQFLLILTVYILLLLVLALGLVVLTVRLHKANTHKAEKWKALEAKWDPLTSSIIAGFMTPQALLDKVGPDEQLFFVDYLMRYVPKLEGEARATLCEMAAPYLDRLAARMETGDDEQRARAILTLNTMGFDRYQDLIVKAMDDTSPVVAMLAARSLADTGAIRYLEIVLAKIGLFRSWSASYLTSMLDALARSAPTQLLAFFKEQQYPDWVQAIILKALTQLSCVEAVPLAAQLVREDAQREVQVAALQLLARLGQSDYKPLIRSKCEHADFVIRLHAIKALAQNGDMTDAALLEPLLRDPSHWVALQAAEALKMIGDLEALERFADSEDPHAELALQVLYDQDSSAELVLAARSSAFASKVPQWLRSAYRRSSAVAWRRVGQILFQPETHSEVRLAIARNLRPEADASLYQEAITQLFQPQFKSSPLFLIWVLYRMRPEQSLETLSEFFFQTSERETRAQILKIFQQDALANRRFSSFIQQASQALLPG
ncbi:hypothetical protein COW36_10480 [bacterium (Candidatus Blackallbacteria) CG17_big_fil_post_rev_8_21_14_2_50_48_46]|uniref:HEAT repeat domain-containing protein n=1 Tax=bacterium (Candidatus Blackallbacteria) CG17_big_fil_post_rev_8_21_14_2_50_48_46 TaxID=2014261 RepID=A0A2M7G538_9BACT|nr:MAG: hypothetical protein COW64_20255 [bacterium (Candidatus Blackallbacteria) CG18_big_fil_WC_8_21_14_2_50_49_26]PIW17057.1 MAG: hypothetical protein COW36_10480 [bacterium (Candidatus Blackallbacteria) CG17_big_fil_post_rev_8_21_14_2_50_48_46]PIW47708.1 MAG: hypothetical protein COW20_11740 [bacterium (Candidatus Blackallbacteria) CG13_big_fil_rev_8_21_14_2_50_49_14]